MKQSNLLGCFACILSLVTWARGQAVPTASRVGSIQAGIGGVVTNPDYGQSNLEGLTFWGDFDFLYHYGVEGEIHYFVRTPSDISENSYLAGPRYIFRYKKIDAYAKLLFGLGRFGTQSGSFVNPQTGSYFTYAPGAGVDYHATRHINVRVSDIEIQKWPSFGAHGLTPISWSAGVSYVFH
ncbi:MAG: hypothetical protein WDN23_10165 [Edaphobacter sp.]